MSYEQKFREAEKSFRPFEDFDHNEVVEELASIVWAADYKIRRFIAFNKVIGSLLALSVTVNIVMFLGPLFA